MSEREYLKFDGITCKEAATAFRELARAIRRSLRAIANGTLAYRTDSDALPPVRPCRARTARLDWPAAQRCPGEEAEVGVSNWFWYGFTRTIFLYSLPIIAGFLDERYRNNNDSHHSRHFACLAIGI